MYQKQLNVNHQAIMYYSTGRSVVFSNILLHLLQIFTPFQSTLVFLYVSAFAGCEFEALETTYSFAASSKVSQADLPTLFSVLYMIWNT